jgi:hypothetical protein
MIHGATAPRRPPPAPRGWLISPRQPNEVDVGGIQNSPIGAAVADERLEADSVQIGGSGAAVAPRVVTFRDRLAISGQFLMTASGQIPMISNSPGIDFRDSGIFVVASRLSANR